MHRSMCVIVGRAAYAPDILTFGSADKLWDVYRARQTAADGSDHRIRGLPLQGANELEESIHLGLRARF